MSNAADERQAIVERACESWIGSLIDVSRRNNLLYFRDLTTGTLDLSTGAPALLPQLLQGESIAFKRLLPDPQLDAIDQPLLPDPKGERNGARIRAIARRALSNAEEKGLETLFLALGMATWSVSSDGRPPAAAVLLLPVAIELRGHDWRGFMLRRIGDIQINPILLYHLEAEFHCRIDPSYLLADVDDETAAFDPSDVYSRLLEMTRTVPDFAIDQRIVLSNFAFQKMAMVNDLREYRTQLAQHPLIAALAGYEPARAELAQPRPTVSAAQLDALDPATEFLVLDADSSQQRVVHAVLARQHGVIQGPPGTGKSQTIVNLITSLVAAGRRVLFVAEKRAAIDVVRKRLESVNLGHLALDLHHAAVSRRTVAQQLAASLAHVQSARPVHSSAVHTNLSEQRQRLKEHVQRLHTPFPPSGETVHALQSALLHAAPQVQVTTRWRGSALLRLDPAGVQTVRGALREAQSLHGLIVGSDPSPWRTAAFAAGADALTAIDLVASLSRSQWPQVWSAVQAICAHTAAAPPSSVALALALVQHWCAVQSASAAYKPEISNHNLAQLIADLAPAHQSGLGGMLGRWLGSAYHKALADAQSLRSAGPAEPGAIRHELQALAQAAAQWQECASGWALPVLGLEAAVLEEQLKQLDADLQQLAALLAFPELLETAPSALTDLLQQLAADATTPYRMVRLNELRQVFTKYEIDMLLAELRAQSIPAGDWPACFDYAWRASCLDLARANDPALMAFAGAVHEQSIDDYCRLDREHLALNAARVERKHAEHVVHAMNAYPDQATLIRREGNKRSRHLPLRMLLAQAHNVLLSLHPCWMASPTAVSQLIAADRQYFDVIIFDEASQVLPQDAIPALLRGPQVVVAGDQHQLPPTTFFASGEDESAASSEEDVPTQGFQSVLDLLAGFFEPWLLNWHYRSRDEALIAFSNRHIYADRLITFPSPLGRSAIEHILVPQQPSDEDQSESASLEVQHVVQLVLEHAREHPDQTLGVITLGIKHARAIEQALEIELPNYPELDAFFDTNRPERFFIKNLERVQGDERDVILLSVGYGKQPDGRLLYRFGPLLLEGGERRLNVAVTRARLRMSIISSFSHHDMPPERSSKRGVVLLRAYLEYAAQKGQSAAYQRTRHDPAANLTLLESVCQALEPHGLRVRTHWGASSFPLDLIVFHPESPWRVLAVETDGSTYAALPTVRDRDRLRPQLLAQLGWPVLRLWSLDWAMHREQQIARIVQSYRQVTAGPPPQPTPAIDSTPSQTQSAAAPTRRPRPPVPRRDNIDNYSDFELVDLISWIRSDGLLRTDEDIMAEMVKELGFSRRGSRINARLRAVLASLRR